MTQPHISDLAHELAQTIRGEVAFDQTSRAIYATDASIYQIMPAGVVTPRDSADVAAVVRATRRMGIPIVARGGGTSLAGQTVGSGIQLDFSRHMNTVLEVNATERWAWVEPGIVLETLNTQLAQTGLKFAPDVSPANRATIGGMIANNSSGMYSIVYGKTIDHVLELRVMLSDGTITTMRPLSPAELHQQLHGDSLEARITRTLHRLAHDHAAEIDQRFPKVLRRVGGYNLDRFTGEHWNLAELIVGSEGTLAIILAAKIRLVARPAQTAIGILAFDSLDAALDAVVPCLECQPAAVELFDDILLDLTRRSPEYGQYLAQFVTGTPQALLQVEFFGATTDVVAAQLEQLQQHLRERHGIDVPCTIALTPALKRAVLEVRKAGLPLLQSLSPDLKPETFVEDSAVPPEQLAEYIRRFRAICHSHGVRVAFYGHASVGLMHARPLINLKQASDVKIMRAIAEQIRDLVLEYGGALSGEHGDGMLRAEFNRSLFGDTLYEAFREIKRTCDPHGLLNPGKIVDAPAMDTNLRYGGDYRSLPLTTNYRFADTGGFAGAIELCNGNGLCRKPNGGTMCPSYMVTHDEQHSTRGRANALRMVLSGALPVSSLTDQRMYEVMELCVECKGCTGECPSRVNMTRIKSEWLSQYYQANGIPLRSRLFGNIRRINQLGSRFAPLANLLLRLPFVPYLQQRLFGISQHRRLPEFAPTPFQHWFASRRVAPHAHAGSVLLFPDTFADYNEPELAQAAVHVLEAAGYRVVLPARQVCCGRPMISKGLLPQAKALLQQQLDILGPYADAGVPIIGLEPSCLLTFRDELPDLIDDPRTAIIARQSFLFDEFLARQLRSAQISLSFQQQPGQHFLVHGHCHQKALSGTTATIELLQRIPGATVREIDSGCCGMAGSFGYEAEHYVISQAMGERVLFPAIRSLPSSTTIVAAGTSCRHQIADGTGRRAMHIAQVLASALDDRPVTIDH